MKTQLLTFVLLFTVVISSAFAQSRTSFTSSELPDHPLLKTLKLLERGAGYSSASKIGNQNYQLNELEEQVWANGGWLPYLRSENIYQSGYRIENRGYYMPEPGNWEMSSRSYYTYENNNLTTYLLQGISGGEPITQERTLYSYQQSGGQVYLQSVEYQEWSQSEQEWINFQRSSVTVENGIISEVLDEMWEDGQWILYERYFFEELQGDVIETIQMYDDFMEDWVNYEQNVYTDISFAELYISLVEFIDFIEDGRSYLLIGMLPDFISYEWDDFEENWIALDRQVTSVSSNLKNGATTANSISMESYNLDTEDWVTYYEYILGYVDNGNPVNFSFYAAGETMESEEDATVSIYEEDYNYDENDLMETILQYGNLFGDPFKQSADDSSPAGRILLTWGEVSTSVEPVISPYAYRLNAAYPNPFNPSTVIPFQMATSSDVKIQVFDMLGRNVATLLDEFRPAGNHTVRFDGSGLSSGVYMIRMIAPGSQMTRSVTLIK